MTSTTTERTTTMLRSTPFALAAVAVAVLAGCSAQTGGAATPEPTASASSSAAGSTEASMADASFAMMMIPHHEQAVEMVDVLLAKEGVDPEVADLAERIRAAQAPEIEQMRSWLDEWGMPSHDHGGMSHGDGMMSEEDMAALEAADGPEASRLFLEQMIEHHEGAVDMAETEIESGQHPDAVALAERIVASQTAEIDEMRALLER